MPEKTTDKQMVHMPLDQALLNRLDDLRFKRSSNPGLKPHGGTADDIGLSVPPVRCLHYYVAEAGFAVQSDPRRALSALDEALQAREEPAAEGE